MSMFYNISVYYFSRSRNAFTFEYMNNLHYEVRINVAEADSVLWSIM